MRSAAECRVHPQGRSCSPRMAERGFHFHTSVSSSSLPATGDGDTERVRDRWRVPERSRPVCVSETDRNSVSRVEAGGQALSKLREWFSFLEM